MRILIVSDCTKLPGFSTLFIQPWEWALSVRDMYPNARFDVLLPEKDKVWGDYDSSPYEGQERIKIHYVPMITTGGIQQCVIATRQLYDLFNVNYTPYYYDAVLNPRAIFSPVLKKVLKPKFVKSTINIPIFNHTGSVRTNIPKHQQMNTDYGEEDVIAETVAWLTDYSLFMCGAELDMARDNCATYLAGKQIQKFLKNSFIAPMGGIRFDVLDKYVPALPKSVGPRGVCVFFGGRWVEGKGFSTYLEFVEKAFKSGAKIYGIATTPADEDVRAEDLRKKYPMIEFYPNCNRETFYEKLKEGHLFLSFSMWEGFGISYWEMMYQGLVGIFLDRPWNRSVLPEEYWALRAKNPKEMYRVFRDAITPADMKVNQAVLEKRVRPYLRDHYERSKVNAAIYDWMLQKTRRHYALQFGEGHSMTFKNLVAKALGAMPRPAPIEMVFKMMSACAQRSGLEFGRRNQFVSRMFIRQCAQFMGYRDLCDQDEPMLVDGDAFTGEIR
jgi:glycosyltransferase involved in cell wall biosynthesis